MSVSVWWSCGAILLIKVINLKCIFRASCYRACLLWMLVLVDLLPVTSKRWRRKRVNCNYGKVSFGLQYMLEEIYDCRRSTLRIDVRLALVGAKVTMLLTTVC